MRITTARTNYVDRPNPILWIKNHNMITVDIGTIPEKVTMLNNKQLSIIRAEIKQFLLNNKLNLCTTENQDDLLRSEVMHGLGTLKTKSDCILANYTTLGLEGVTKNSIPVTCLETTK